MNKAELISRLHSSMTFFEMIGSWHMADIIRAQIFELTKDDANGL